MAGSSFADGASETIINEISQDERDETLVFQCRSCHVIIGDSLAWICANEHLRSITLHSTTENVTVVQNLVTSTEGPDFGLTFSALKCANCKSDLGKIYKTTPKALDDIRELFTFSVDKCNNYQCGPAGAKQVANVSIPQYGVQKEVEQLKKLMLQMNTRINTIEKCLQIDDEDEEVDDEDEDGKDEEEEPENEENVTPSDEELVKEKYPRSKGSHKSTLKEGKNASFSRSDADDSMQGGYKAKKKRKGANTSRDDDLTSESKRQKINYSH